MPWVDQSWAFDALLALLVDRWGWSAAIALAAIGLAWLYRAMARDLIGDGISPVIAVVVSIFAVCIGAIHFLIRPHLFTFGFVYLALRACQAQHLRGGWAVLKVAIYTAVLANLHGGFVALPVIVATAGLGHAVSGAWDHTRRRNVARFGLTFVACCLAALANPYGFGLYRHVASLLVSSGVTSLIIEYQPPHFGTPEAKVLEWVLLALVGLPVVSSRRFDRYQLCHVLVWLHLALSSIRNAPLFALVAAPALATLIDGLPIAVRAAWKRPPRPAFIPAVATSCLLLLVMSGLTLGGFDLKKWPLRRARNAQPPADGAPAFPRARLGRVDRGGMPLGSGGHTLMTGSSCSARMRSSNMSTCSQAVRRGTRSSHRDRIDMVWLRPDRGLAKRLLREPDWNVVYRDKVSILFRQEASGRVAHR